MDAVRLSLSIVVLSDMYLIFLGNVCLLDFLACGLPLLPMVVLDCLLLVVGCLCCCLW
jgi:hypothetical protein